ncbi:MAG: glycosyltransferase family 4 protein, partial [Chloroflexi bacterium]|nr:glycosyltransferase family 4 protein [Chloroflexota bacterium]
LSVPDDDPRSLSEQLMRALCKEGLRDELRKNGLEFAKNYSWTIITGSLIKLYQKLGLQSR